MFVEIHRQGSVTSSRFPGPLWAEEREVIQFSMKKGRQLLLTTTLELRLGSYDACSHFVNDQFSVFVFNKKSR